MLLQPQQVRSKRLAQIPGIMPVSGGSLAINQSIGGLTMASSLLGGVVDGMKGNFFGAATGLASAVVTGLKVLSLVSPQTAIAVSIGLALAGTIFGGMFGKKSSAQKKLDRLSNLIAEARHNIKVSEGVIGTSLLIAGRLEQREVALQSVIDTVRTTITSLNTAKGGLDRAGFAHLTLQGRLTLLNTQLSVQNANIATLEARKNQLKVEIDAVISRTNQIGEHYDILVDFYQKDRYTLDELAFLRTTKGMDLPRLNSNGNYFRFASGTFTGLRQQEGCTIHPSTTTTICKEGSLFPDFELALKGDIVYTQQKISALNEEKIKNEQEQVMLTYQLTDWGNRRDAVLNEIETTNKLLANSSGTKLTQEGQVLALSQIVEKDKQEITTLKADIQTLQRQRESLALELRSALTTAIGTNQTLTEFVLGEVVLLKKIVDDALASEKGLLVRV